MRAEGSNLLGGSPHVLRGKPKLDKTAEVADEEHDAVADKTDTSQCNELGAEVGRGHSRRRIRRRGRISRHTKTP